MKDLLDQDGKMFRFEKGGNIIEGMITVENGTVYLCQDYYKGRNPNNLKGYKHALPAGDGHPYHMSEMNINNFQLIDFVYELKNNKVAFCLMAPYLQEFAKSIEYTNFMYLGCADSWMPCTISGQGFIDTYVYRLLPDYTEPVKEKEPEYYRLLESECNTLRDELIGFEFDGEEGIIFNSPIGYKHAGLPLYLNCEVSDLQTGKAKPVHAKWAWYRRTEK